VLLVQMFLHTFLLIAFECRAAELVHEEQDGFVPVPQVLPSQDPHPEVQHCCGSDPAGLGALHHVALEHTQNYTCSLCERCMGCILPSAAGCNTLQQITNTLHTTHCSRSLTHYTLQQITNTLHTAGDH